MNDAGDQTVGFDGRPEPLVQSCKFRRGQLVHHKGYDYRGVVFDVDACCQASEEWYQRNRTQPERDQPWYHVLVHGAEHTTYVAEANLEPDGVGTEIDHPMISDFFDEFRDGGYALKFDA